MNTPTLLVKFKIDKTVALFEVGALLFISYIMMGLSTPPKNELREIINPTITPWKTA